MKENNDSIAESLDVEHLQTWVGRTYTVSDRASSGPLAGLAALLDHATPPWREGEVPPLGHWLYFLERAPQSTLDVDGHSKRGDFLPPVRLPRRMWAAGRVTFLARIPLGADMTRRSTVAAVTAKRGRSGPMVFVTVRHEVSLGEVIAIVEDQDIVYRMPPGHLDPSASDCALDSAALRLHANHHSGTRAIVPLFSADIQCAPHPL